MINIAVPYLGMIVILKTIAQMVMVHSLKLQWNAKKEVCGFVLEMSFKQEHAVEKIATAKVFGHPPLKMVRHMKSDNLVYI